MAPMPTSGVPTIQCKVSVAGASVKMPAQANPSPGSVSSPEQIHRHGSPSSGPSARRRPTLQAISAAPHHHQRNVEQPGTVADAEIADGLVDRGVARPQQTGDGEGHDEDQGPEYAAPPQQAGGRGRPLLVFRASCAIL